MHRLWNMKFSHGLFIWVIMDWSDFHICSEKIWGMGTRSYLVDQFNSLPLKSTLDCWVCPLILGSCVTLLLLCWVFIAAGGLSLVVERGGCSPVMMHKDFSLLWSPGFRWWALVVMVHGLLSCGTRVVSPRNVDSSKTRNQSRVPCNDRHSHPVY